MAMAKRDRTQEALDRLAAAVEDPSAPEAKVAIDKALRDRSALVVAAALKVIRENELSGLEDQMRAVVGSLDRLLTGLGGDLRSVLKFTTYLVDPDDIADFYEVRARMWPTWWADGDGVPPNTLLVVQRLVRPEFRIEIEALAVVPEPESGGAS